MKKHQMGFQFEVMGQIPCVDFGGGSMTKILFFPNMSCCISNERERHMQQNFAMSKMIKKWLLTRFPPQRSSNK